MPFFVFQEGQAKEVAIILPSTHVAMGQLALKTKICPAAGQGYCQVVGVMIPELQSANLESSFRSKHDS